MKQIHFPNWEQVLNRTDLPGRVKGSWAITIRWYLNFCRRGRAGVNVQSARDFIEWAEKLKRPDPRRLEWWKEALRWFFRAGQAAAGSTPAMANSKWQMAKGAHVHHPESTHKRHFYSEGNEGNKGAEGERNSNQALTPTPSHPLRRRDSAASPIAEEGGERSNKMGSWRNKFLTVIRRRHYSYRTEQSYLVWIERYAKFVETDALETFGVAGEFVQHPDWDASAPLRDEP